MPRESDKNRQMFHRGHYEVIAARFREVVSKTIIYGEVDVLKELATTLADRFEFDNDRFDRAIFMERCGFDVD
jgi:hypothetical protein